MKTSLNRSWSILLVIALLAATALLSACSAPAAPVAPAPTNPPAALVPAATEPTVPAATAEPTAAPAGWQLVSELDNKYSAFAAGFLDGQTGITVGYMGAIYATADGGQTWTRAENRSPCRYGVDLISSQTLWSVGNGGSVRLSTDAGQTWQGVKTMPTSGVSGLASFVDDQLGWVSNGKQIWATDDGGQTWLALPRSADLPNLVALQRLSAGDGFVLDGSGRLLQTHDGGQTWSEVGWQTGPLAKMISAANATIRFVDEHNGLIVVTLKEGGMAAWETQDGGQTWTSLALDAADGVPFISHDGQWLTVTRVKQVLLYRLAN